jgi:hypothetical protein
MARQRFKPTEAELIDELSTVFDDQDAARALLERIDYPRGRTPDWTDAVTFWQTIARRIRDGIMPSCNELNALFEAAASIYPGNLTFAAWRHFAAVAEVPVQVQARSKAEPVKVLILAANPLDSDRSRVDGESSAIEEIGRNSALLGRPIDVKVHHAVQVKHLIKLIEDSKPSIVHFAVHGESGGGLILDDGRGGSQILTYEALSRLFRDLIAEDVPVRCLVLNGCYTAEAIPALGKIVDVLIGSHQEIADESSLAFANGLYTSRAEGATFGKAIRRGKLAMKLVEPPSHATGDKPWVFDPEKTIVVSVKEGVDLERMFL